MNELYDIIVIGAGTAGLTAGIYAVRAGHTVLVFEELAYGGQIINTPEIENFPALPKISGFEFAENLYNQALALGVKVVFEQITEIKDLKNEKEVLTSSKTYRAKTVIIANGAKNANLGCKNEDAFKGKGVSYCATCDGAFFRNKTVAIVGGGNTALEDALFLSNNCQKVYLIHRRDAFRGENHLADTVIQRSNIEPVFNSVVESINGDSSVSSVTLKNVQTNELSELTVNGVFIAIGQRPDNQRFSSLVQTDDYGYIIASEDCKTSCSGIFTAGDTRTKLVRQLTTAAADGSVAALAASAYIHLLP